MVGSINKEVELEIKATSFLGFSSYGFIVVGDRGFEFFNDKDPKDFVQIPWAEVDKVAVSILFGGRYIPRFGFMTKKNGTLTFSTRDNKKTLRAIRKYLGPDKIVKSLGFFQVLGRGIKGIFNRK